MGRHEDIVWRRQATSRGAKHTTRPTNAESQRGVALRLISEAIFTRLEECSAVTSINSTILVLALSQLGYATVVPHQSGAALSARTYIILWQPTTGPHARTFWLSAFKFLGPQHTRHIRAIKFCKVTHKWEVTFYTVHRAPRDSERGLKGDKILWSHVCPYCLRQRTFLLTYNVVRHSCDFSQFKCFPMCRRNFMGATILRCTVAVAGDTTQYSGHPKNLCPQLQIRVGAYAHITTACQVSRGISHCSDKLRCCPWSTRDIRHSAHWSDAKTDS